TVKMGWVGMIGVRARQRALSTHLRRAGAREYKFGSTAPTAMAPSGCCQGRGLLRRVPAADRGVRLSFVSTAMAKKRKEPQAEVPEGYTPEQWAEYQADPVGFCIKELKSKTSDVRFNAVDILRGCAGDAKAAIPALCELLGKEKVATVRAQC